VSWTTALTVSTVAREVTGAWTAVIGGFPSVHERLDRRTVERTRRESASPPGNRDTGRRRAVLGSSGAGGSGGTRAARDHQGEGDRHHGQDDEHGADRVDSGERRRREGEQHGGDGRTDTLARGAEHG